MTLKSYFNSLPHAEVDRKTGRRRDADYHFNSLPHAEVDDVADQIAEEEKNFNSLPHAEVDGAEDPSGGTYGISTHYLTQR